MTKGKYTRRELGGYMLGLSLAGGAMSALPSRAEAAETSYETDAAGVPQPTNATELEASLNDAPLHSLVNCPAGTVYEPTSTVVVPDTVTLDARGATIRPRHSGTAVALGSPGTEPDNGGARLLGGTVEMGSSGAVAVLNRSDSRKFWQTAPIGTHVTATPGSGTTGHQILKTSSANNNFYHYPIFSTDGVDTPLHIRAEGTGGFITSINAHLTASDFVNAVVVDGGANVSHTYTMVDLSPTNRAQSVLVSDVDGRRNCSEGTVGGKAQYDQLVLVNQVRNGRMGQHTHLSWDGYSSAADSSLVTDNTGTGDTRVVDFSGGSA